MLCRFVQLNCNAHTVQLSSCVYQNQWGQNCIVLHCAALAIIISALCSLSTEVQQIPPQTYLVASGSGHPCSSSKKDFDQTKLSFYAACGMDFQTTHVSLTFFYIRGRIHRVLQFCLLLCKYVFQCASVPVCLCASVY